MDQTTNLENQDDHPLTIPPNVPLTNIMLPNPWVLYLYDKQLFKKMANRPNFQAKPHKEICAINTVNDLIYITELMAMKCESKEKMDNSNNKKINLDANDYIIMRKGIEPIWEDPKNWNGGTFSIKMSHSIGYNVWSDFVMYMLGETLTHEMDYINGITVSYISGSYDFNNPSTTNGNSYTYIKIWDGKPGRTRDQFVNILPLDILENIKKESLQYAHHSGKDKFNDSNIVSKLKHTSRGGYRGRGGFSSQNRRRY